jgi:hypothetical protein
MKFNRLIYLDTAFIAAAFEEITGSKAISKITKTDDISAGASGGFFRFGASAKETKEYPVSAQAMFAQIEKRLNRFPELDLKTVDGEYPPYFWTTGVFCVGSIRTKENEKLVKESHFYEIGDGNSDTRRLISLVTNDVYFTSGYDQMSKYIDTLTESLWKRVRALVRILYQNRVQENVVGAPMVILEIEGTQP